MSDVEVKRNGELLATVPDADGAFVFLHAYQPNSVSYALSYEGYTATDETGKDVLPDLLQHQPDSMLKEYAGGGPEADPEVKAHLDNCKRCRSALAAIEQMK